jgi:carbamoyltransferase
MITCGLKLTHDGAVAIVADDELVFSIEMEKLRNKPRHSQVEDLAEVEECLHDFGYAPDDVDAWVVDGWDGRKRGHVQLLSDGAPIRLELAPYRETEAIPDIFAPGFRGSLPLGGQSRPYTSHVHIAGHVASAYCASPFGQRGEPSLVLVWDGGLFPRLYCVDPERGVRNGGELFPLTGHTYAIAAHHFGPFHWDKLPTSVNDDLSVAGKLMAYIATGTPQPEFERLLRELFVTHFDSSTGRATTYRAEVGGFGSTSEPVLSYLHAYFRELADRLAARGIGKDADADVLASVHLFLERLLVERLESSVHAWLGDGPWNVCFVGGCALNIKWNSTLRSLDLFREVWVPPFPNDSGSAIGAALLGRANPAAPLRWHARLGPWLKPTGRIPDGWRTEPFSPTELGRLLHATGEPCVVLDGRAELGPRALGGRSILAPAVTIGMKDRLNQIKQREEYRPVAPICLEEAAPQIFDPGTPDPYMLFEHLIRGGWQDRIPAVRHLDGSARLQTVGAGDGVLREILDAYHQVSGIPVLCNTSANLKGRGFFPDVASALAWDEVDRVWSDHTLYTREPH